MDFDGADELDLEDDDQAFVQTNPATARHNAPPINHMPPNAAQPAWMPPAAVPVLPIPAGPVAPVSRIPGPAGRPGPVGGGGGGHGGGGTPSQEFSTPEWLAALQDLGIGVFDEGDSRATVAGALALLKSDVMPRLLVYVVSLQQAHNGESYVKLRDPTGTIGGTLTADTLTAHPGISRGAVLLLEKATVLKTPSPHPIRHLCIVPETIKRVVPRQRRAAPGGGAAWPAAQALQAPQQAAHPVVPVRPALNASAPGPPAPPPALQRPAPAVPHAPPPQPQGDTAEDLLAGLDDDFGF